MNGPAKERMPNFAALSPRARNAVGDFIFPESVEETAEEADASGAKRVPAFGRREFLRLPKVGRTTLQEVTEWLRERGQSWCDAAAPKADRSGAGGGRQPPPSLS